MTSWPQGSCCVGRPIVLIAGARRLSALYMKPALIQLARLPNVTVIPTIEEGPTPHPSLRLGRIEAHVPPLDASDIVYACGSPRMVSTLAGLVESAGATFYADPFESAGPDEPVGLLGKLKTLVQPRRPAQQSGEVAFEAKAPALVPTPQSAQLGGEERRTQRPSEPRRAEPGSERDYSLAVLHPRSPHGEPAGQQDNSRKAAGQFASGHA